MRLTGLLRASARSNFYITTPIFYANSSPHVGHLYSALLADAQTRWKRVKQGHETILFSTGTDEHGYKIQKRAQLEKDQDCLKYCDQVSARFRDLFDQADIGYDDFVRTTESRHASAVGHFWRDLVSKGYIYKSTYQGWYSVNDECFLTEDQLECRQSPETGETRRYSLESGHPTEWTSETNYMFRLSQFKDKLRQLLATGFVTPAKYQEVLHTQIDTLEDLSVSRERSRVHWGLPVPDDPQQIVYVWLDALVNYLTVAGYPHRQLVWPPDFHVVGKDILRFHAIYWPAFLMAAGLPMPRQIFCHGHWLVDNRKMSKSIGNVIDPFRCLSQYGKDGLRYFLLREGVPEADSNISEDKFSHFVNAELSNTLGNLYQRCLPFNPRKVYPSWNEVEPLLAQEDLVLLDKLDEVASQCDVDFESFNFYKGIPKIMDTVRACNNLVQEYKPWLLAKSQSQQDSERLNKMLFIVYETLRITGILLQPITPSLSSDLLARMSVPATERFFVHAKVNRMKATSSEPVVMANLKKDVLFKRIK